MSFLFCMLWRVWYYVFFISTEMSSQGSQGMLTDTQKCGVHQIASIHLCYFIAIVTRVIPNLKESSTQN